MKNGAAMAIGVVAVALAAGGGYWAGHRGPANTPQGAAPNAFLMRQVAVRRPHAPVANWSPNVRNCSCEISRSIPAFW